VGSAATRRTLLDDVMPAYDVASRHTTWVAADPARVYQAARSTDLGGPRLVRVLLGLRAAPAWLAGAIRSRPALAGPRIDQQRVGPVAFTLVAETPGEEFVLGIMGRFWTSTGGIVAASPEQFRRPPPAGLAQAIWNFRVERSGAGTALSTETRIRCGDPATRRHFGWYWALIRPGSGLLRNSLLRDIRRRAEQPLEPSEY
jgi:hypothetical protein